MFRKNRHANPLAGSPVCTGPSRPRSQEDVYLNHVRKASYHFAQALAHLRAPDVERVHARLQKILISYCRMAEAWVRKLQELNPPE